MAPLRLIDDLINALLLTATTASIATALAEGRQGLSARLLLSFLPPAPRPEDRHFVGPAEASGGIGAAIERYEQRLAFVTDVTARMAAAGSSPDAASARALAATWRELAMIGLEALVVCATAHGMSLDAVRHEGLETARKLLERVDAGETPCVDSYGRVEIPLPAERRGAVRKKRNFQAYFMVNEGIQRVSVVDVGAQGLGVRGLAGVAPGASIALILKPGCTLPGSVAWVDDDRQGIRLDAPIPPDAPFVALRLV